MTTRGAKLRAGALVPGKMRTAEQRQRADQQQEEENDGYAPLPHGRRLGKLYDLLTRAVHGLLKMRLVSLHMRRISSRRAEFNFDAQVARGWTPMKQERISGPIP